MQDDGPGMAAVPARPGTGTGLRNTRERLAQLYGTSADLRITSVPDGGALVALTPQRTLASIAHDRAAAAEPAGELSLGPPEEAERGHDGDPAPRFAPRRLGVRTGTKVVLVDVAAIDWVEAYGDYARIHRSLIVNLQRVREMHRESDGGGAIVLANGVRLRVARGRWESLQAALRMEEF